MPNARFAARSKVAGCCAAPALRRSVDVGRNGCDARCHRRGVAGPATRHGRSVDPAGLHPRDAAFGHQPGRASARQPSEGPALGERLGLPDALARVCGTPSIPASLAQRAARWSAASCGGLARLCRGGAPDAPAAAARITDKLPANFQFVGLIHAAMPNARIIHVRRDPVDTCLSLFSILFPPAMPSRIPTSWRTRPILSCLRKTHGALARPAAGRRHAGGAVRRRGGRSRAASAPDGRVLRS